MNQPKHRTDIPMNQHHVNGIGCLLAALAIGLSHASAAKPPKNAAPEVDLTTGGNQLLAEYSGKGLTIRDFTLTPVK